MQQGNNKARIQLKTHSSCFTPSGFPEKHGSSTVSWTENDYAIQQLHSYVYVSKELETSVQVKSCKASIQSSFIHKNHEVEASQLFVNN